MTTTERVKLGSAAHGFPGGIQPRPRKQVQPAGDSDGLDDGSAPPLDDSNFPGDLLPVPAAEDRPQAIVDVATGGVDSAGTVPPPGPSLSDEFWTARPYLAHIRQAAHARCRSAEAVLGSVLAGAAALTPPSVGLPAIVGDRATLDLLVASVGPPGSGKSSGHAVGRRLLPTDRSDIRDGFLLGSGEGIANAYLGPPEQVDEGDGKKRTIRRQLYTAVLAFADEGQTVLELGARKGAILLPQLRTAWSGGTLGQENAAPETWRRVEAGRYRFAAVIALQPDHAVKLLGDAGGGLPQRFLWANATDPTIPDDPPDWPGPLDWTPPHGSIEGGDLTVDPTIASEIRGRDRARSRGELIVDTLDAHRDQLRLKVAGLLAILDQRRHINPDDWTLAGTILDISDHNRGSIVEAARLAARDTEDAAHARAARRELHVRNTVANRATLAMAKAIGRKVHRVWTSEHRPTTRRETWHAVKSNDRREGSYDEALYHAIDNGWITTNNDEYHPGPSTPA